LDPVQGGNWNLEKNFYATLEEYKISPRKGNSTSSWGYGPKNY